jgi:hypothetical protein
MAILTKSILVLEDGKISAFDFQNKETYLQPEIVVNSLDALELVTIDGRFKESINIDVTIQSIDGVAFAGNFAALETALRLAALKANGLSNGGVGGGGGGDATAANQVLQIAELQKLTSLNSPSQQELTNPAAVVVSSWGKISFVCSGAITATINGNSIVYPFVLGGSSILGAEFEADSVSLNSITFNGTGTLTEQELF